jgi:spore coat protein CotH
MKKLSFSFLPIIISLCLHAQIPGDILFNSNNMIHTVKFTFADTNWYSILVNNYNLGNQLDSNIYYSCSVEIDGTLMTNVGVKFKGNSSWNHPNGKKSMKISFAEFVPNQRYDSLKQLNLNNSYNDPTFLREKLYLDVLKQNNIEGPRCQYSSVFVNNQPYAFYTLIEEIDKTFLETHYGGNGGNLYKGDPQGDLKWEGMNQSSYYDNFELKTNEDVNDWSDLLALINAINNTPALQLLDTLEKYINIHQFIKHYAAYIVFATLDSYVGSGHNFFIYYNKQTNQFEFIQWDTNGAFGRHKPQGQGLTDETYLNPFFQFVPLGSRPLTDKILSNSILKSEFIDAMCSMNQQYLNPIYLHHQIDSISNIIKPLVYADSRKQFTNAAFDSNLVYQVNVTPGLKNFSTNRYHFLKDTLTHYGCYPAAVAELVDDTFVDIYPNPISSLFHINASIPLEKVLIYDVVGQVRKKGLFQKEKKCFNKCS